MRTEVLIPFAFDTTAIEERLQEHGWEMVEQKFDSIVKEGIFKGLPSKGRGGYGYGITATPTSIDDVDWKTVVNLVVREVIEDHVQEIIDEAAMIMAERAVRKRSWREIMASIKEELDESQD